MGDMQLVVGLGDPAPGDQLGLQRLLLPAQRLDLLLERAGARRNPAQLGGAVVLGKILLARPGENLVELGKASKLLRSI
jgi:hypothetical protein